ncbi:ATP-binding response regulator [Hydrogenophaga sp. BPS33]|uniref:ATP-binding response regulator n=1 Tax=Hydrogenophaga sp. BPS33 TaxID=2651974 RepID=UPI0013200AB8|nr:ATP-binding protein [Hydrogenophaga sp. BPS33]QHE87762.1 response regulator [Hydrogenophaga sp. BPS33]
MSPPTPAPLAVQRVQLELLLEKTGPVRILSPIPFATPLALLFYANGASFLPLVWLGLFYAVVAITYLRRRRLEARGPLQDDELPGVLQGRVRDILLLGTMWGTAPWLLSAHGSVEDLLLISLFIMGAISLGSAIVSTHRQTIAAFSVPAALGMVSACLWHGGGIGWVLGVCMALFLLMTLKWTFQQADLLAQSLTVRFEKEDLARRLAQQVELVENADREKSRFLASASHDLRQPLHAISLFTSVLEHARPGQDVAQTVQGLGHSVRMLNQSLDTMLDISRLDAGAVQPRIEPLRVHELFLSLSHTYAGSAQDKGLQIRFRAPGDLVVASDALLLARLLGNLIDNAIKYTRTGGVLVAARSCATARRGGAVCFEVVDTGIGIAREHQARVFDEFYQLANPQRDRAAGLGIGLSIVQRLARLLDHPMALCSRPGRGTRFRVWVRERIPRATPPLDVPATGLPDTLRLPRQVLVIDDEPTSREAMRSLLSTWGCTVHAAGDLAQARQLLRTHPVDAVVSDFRLPGERNGLDHLLELQQSAPHLRCLLVTGETAPQRLAEIQASGMAFLHKPVQADALRKALSR